MLLKNNLFTPLALMAAFALAGVTPAMATNLAQAPGLETANLANWIASSPNPYAKKTPAGSADSKLTQSEFEALWNARSASANTPVDSTNKTPVAVAALAGLNHRAVQPESLNSLVGPAATPAVSATPEPRTLLLIGSILPLMLWTKRLVAKRGFAR